MKTTFFRIVPHHRAFDYVLLGWLPLNGLYGSCHGLWSVMFHWQECACGRPMKEPKDRCP